MLQQLALEAIDQLQATAPRSHLLALLGTALVLGLVGALAAARSSGSRAVIAAGALSGLALAFAVSLTLFRGGFGHASLSRLSTCAVTDPMRLTGEGLANLALFAPAAFLAVLAVGRPLRVTAGVAAVSLVVEAVQAIEWVGVCDSSDVVHNTGGGLVAALAAAALRTALSRMPGSDACPRSC